MSYREENIYEHLASTLGAIATSGGYENNISGHVTRWAAPPGEEYIDHTTFPAFIVINGPETVEREKILMLRVIRPRVRGYISDRTTPSTDLNSLKGDAIKAVTAQRTMGGNAHDTKYKGSTIIDTEEKPYACVDIQFEIRFETTTTSP